MSIVIRPSGALPADVDALGVGVFTDQLADGGTPEPLDAAFLAARGFKGKPGESCVMPRPGGGLAVALGLGERDRATTATFRRAAAALARAVERQESVATTLLDQAPKDLDPPAVAQALAEGVLLGAYRYTALKSDPDAPRLATVTLVAGDGLGDRERGHDGDRDRDRDRSAGAAGAGDRLGEAVERGVAAARAVTVARDLVNQPGGSLTPRRFAAEAVRLAEASSFSAEVLGRKAIRRERLGGLLGVNRGSEEPPRFVKLAWEPDSPRATVALVGKGITFDSGGLSLKTADGMLGMKCDMAGAAAVLATFTALEAVRPPVRVLGYMPLTDNMPGGDATRVGDVLHTRSGTTVEVLNTDAEGRLVLADALAMASEARPDAIVDLATLTGACMVALGTRIAGLMGNDDALVEQLSAAAEAAGERVWALPLPDDMRPQLDSEVADLKNVAGGRYGGALIAGVFLREFVAEGVPWAHLDIAGPADALEDDVEARKGGTGFGVRTLLRLLSDFRAP